jgi:hypothetical protein
VVGAQPGSVGVQDLADERGDGDGRPLGRAGSAKERRSFTIFAARRGAPSITWSWSLRLLAGIALQHHVICPRMMVSGLLIS